MKTAEIKAPIAWNELDGELLQNLINRYGMNGIVRNMAAIGENISENVEGVDEKNVLLTLRNLLNNTATAMEQVAADKVPRDPNAAMERTLHTLLTELESVKALRLDDATRATDSFWDTYSTGHLFPSVDELCDMLVELEDGGVEDVGITAVEHYALAHLKFPLYIENEL